MARKALVRISDSLVVNVILLEDGANWQPPEGCEVRDAENAGPGDTWDGAKYVKPTPPNPPAPVEPPIIGFMDGVLKRRGLFGFDDAERRAARAALE